MTASGKSNEALIEAAFTAAIDDALWPQWFGCVSDAFGASGGLLGVLDKRTGLPLRVQFEGVDARMHEEFVGGMVELDPQVPITRNVSGARVYCSGDYRNLTDPRTAEYQSWQIDRSGWVTHLALATELAPQFTSSVSLQYAAQKADNAEKFRRRLEALSPAINSALRLGFINGEKLTEEYWRGLRAERDAIAVFLIGERGCVLRMNAKAERLVAAGNILACRLGRLLAAHGAIQPKLEAIVSRAVTPGLAAPGHLGLVSPDGTISHFAQIAPLPRRRRYMVIDEPAAILTIRERKTGAPGDGERWRVLFGLTVAEARIADRLRFGLPAEAIADELRLSVGTIRTHIKRIHDKTETRRNSELAHVLTKIGAKN